MKIYYGSDLHLEFAPYGDELPSGDVLVLAGDICVARQLERGDASGSDHLRTTLNFFHNAVRNFKKVVYVHGNHEAYGSTIDGAHHITRDLLPVAPMENTVIDLDDETVLFAATLWTDMDGGNPLTELAVTQGLADFHLIKNFSVMDAKELHLITLNNLRYYAQKNHNKNMIVVTHHAPSPKAIHTDHAKSPINGAFVSNLEELIEEHGNIKHWIHGHTHVRREYEVGQCQVHANCRGYLGYEVLAETFHFRSFDI